MGEDAMAKRNAAEGRKFCGLVWTDSGFSFAFAATVADAANGAAQQFLRDMRAAGRKRLTKGKIALPVTVLEANGRDWYLCSDGRVLADKTGEELAVAAEVEVEV